MLLTKVKKQKGIVAQQEIDKVAQLLSFCGDGDYIISIKKSDSKRSIDQNKLFWLLINCLREYFGYTQTQMHDIVCKKFLSYNVDVVDKEGNVKQCSLYKTTKNLSVKEMSDLIDKMYLLGEEFNIKMPRPDDQVFDLFVESYGNQNY